MATTCRVDVLAYDGCFAAEVFGIIDVLTIANTVSAVLRPSLPAPFAGRVVSVRGRRVTVSGGVRLDADRADEGADQLVVSGCSVDALEELSPRLTQWRDEIQFLRRLSERERPVAAVCLGAFLLAEAGLLRGRRATTSWLFAPELARLYPDVDVQATAMVVRDGSIATTGAFSAVHDLALDIVTLHAGAEVARMTARIALVAQARTSQGPFVDEQMLAVTHSRFSDGVRLWLRRHLGQRYDLRRLARAHHVSTRTLLRRFGAETGESPLAYLQRIRVSAAKRLLETSDMSVREITEQVGYTDAATFRSLFQAQVGVTPSDYRRQCAHATV